MNIHKTISVSIIASALATSAFAATAYQNQVGFLTKSQKQMAVIGAEGEDIVFKSASGTEVLKVKVPEAQTWEPAGDTAASLVDFSEIQTAGTYQAYVKDEAVGHPIVIADDALEEATKASIKFFYFQRASMELTEEYAGIYAREAGHPDTSVKYHASTGKTDTEATFNGSKGWYDAGDYGKYIVNSGITTYTLLQLYQHNKAYFETLNLNIPESGNKVPDILDEIRWNLDWMLTMQDEDGGVFHKLTTKQFAGMVMPAKATAQRYAIGKGIEATWNFAAVMTLASEIYKPFDSEFAKACIDAAQKAVVWATANPYASYEQPSDVGTGTYTGAVAWAAKMWTLIEMYRLSSNPDILDEIKELPVARRKASLPNWQNSYLLGIYTIATNPDIFEKDLVDTATAIIVETADSYLKGLDNNGYGIALNKGDFNWGSNGTASNKGMLLIHAYILTKDAKYLDAANGIVDYVLGRNPLDLSYLTGYGVNQVMKPHHRPSQSDGIDAPVPGMIAGGPNSGATDCAKKFVVPNAAAKSYYDNSCSYATNEVAINWNAPFAYLIGSVQAIASTGNTYDIHSKTAATYDIASIEAKSQVRVAPQASGKRLVLRGQKVQVEYTDRNGIKSHFSISGKRIR
ncbi:glycoside hydrolase family 9 protein [uncultured Fibrobacter sp.]|uniref:glycoside hydrolase family 9 protein n=1 Tax=uncultured Fibrobacter sp. TaxID=261512 RepID=UPI002625DA6F|nr:glycoside hydrolase family 9 protein [uncultured Fibrobacter sp.]